MFDIKTNEHKILNNILKRDKMLKKGWITHYNLSFTIIYIKSIDSLYLKLLSLESGINVIFLSNKKLIHSYIRDKTSKSKLNYKYMFIFSCIKPSRELKRSKI